MAHDFLSERVRDALAHLCAGAALAYAARASQIMHGWVTVPAAAPEDDAPLVSVIVPARNEERSIERCVRSLLAQSASIELIVVDDRSTDRTGAILDDLARNHPALCVLRGEPLPAGWVGKPWALAQGVRAARGAWLLFTDADTCHDPRCIASALAFARGRDVDALTLWTRQELGSWAERAVLPTILGMVLLGSGTMRQLNDPADTRHALANGQFILVRRAAYDALGGHEALRGEILDDVTFARRLKVDGRFRLMLADGQHLVSVRMYTSLAELWEGFTKNMYLGAGGDLRVLAAAAAFLAAMSVVPAALAVDAAARRRPLHALEALLVLGCGIAAEARGLRRTGIPRRLAWFAPFGYAVCAAVMIDSTVRVVGGRGVRWRGRRYTGRSGGTAP